MLFGDWSSSTDFTKRKIMVDYAFGFIADNIWVICFLSAGLYNLYLRKEYRPIIHLSLVLAATYSLTKIFYSQVVVPQDNIVEVYYLYWAGASVFIAATIAIDHQIKNYAFHWPAKLAITLLLVEALLHVAVHIDRNIVSLNSSALPNNHIDNAWWLWGLRNFLLVVDNFFILASLVFPFKAFRSVDDIYKHKFGSSEMQRAFKRVDLLEKIIYIMPNSLKKAHAYQCVQSARFLLEQWGSKGEDRQHLYSANTLCDRARYLAFTSDEIPVEKLEELDGVPKVDYH